MPGAVRQQTESGRTDVKNVTREHRHQRRGATEHDGEQVK